MKPVLRLSAKEMEFFDKLVRFLDDQKQLQGVDEHALTMCVKTWTMVENALFEMEAEGTIQVFSTGAKQISAERQVYERTTKEFNYWCNQLGLTPRARKSLLPQIAPDTPKDDPFDDYLPGSASDR